MLLGRTRVFCCRGGDDNSFSYSVSKDSQKWGIGISEPLQTEFLQIFEICEGAGETWETVHVEIEFT